HSPRDLYYGVRAPGLWSVVVPPDRWPCRHDQWGYESPERRAESVAGLPEPVANAAGLRVHGADGGRRVELVFRERELSADRGPHLRHCGRRANAFPRSWGGRMR